MRTEPPDKFEWRGKHFSFYSHRACESFPCHTVENADDFNCLFCYCPLYLLGRGCGGGFRYLPNGVKDCSACTLPHSRESYGLVLRRLSEAVFDKAGRAEGEQ